MTRNRLFFVGLLAVALLVSPAAVAQGNASDPTPAQDQPTTQEQPQTAVAPAPAPESLTKGIQLNQAKKYKEAETELRAAVQAQPANPAAHLQLGIALFEQGKVDPAGLELDQAKPISLTGTKAEQADYYQYHGSYLARKAKWADAAADLQKGIELDPKEPYNHYYIGVAYNNLKRPDKMVEHLQMFLKLAPNAPEAPKCKALLRAVQ